MDVLCSTAVFCRQPLEAALDGARAAGFRGVDLLMIDGWCHVHPSALAAGPDAAVAADAAFERAGVRLGAANVGFSPRLWERDAPTVARGRAELLATSAFLRARGVTVAALQPRQPDPTRSAAENLALAATTLAEYVDWSADAGVTYALECHSGSVAETVDAALELVQRVPGPKLAYDPSHFVMLGTPLEATLPLLEHSACVHLRDAAPGRMQCPLGDGGVDIAWLVERLHERGYAGTVSIEYLEGDELDAADNARQLREQLLASSP